MPKVEEIQVSPGRWSGGRRARTMRVASSLAEINVVPLVDVMLVLLIIFMVAAPMMQQGFPVQLPQSRQSVPLKTEPVTVTIPVTFRRDGRVQVNDEWVSLELLPERLRQALSGRLTQSVVLAGDGAVTMQDLFRVFDRLREAGIAHIGMQSQPPIRERAP